jgi:hypothetical protein
MDMDSHVPTEADFYLTYSLSLPYNCKDRNERTRSLQIPSYIVTSVFVISSFLIRGRISPRFPESRSGNARKTSRFYCSLEKPNYWPDCQNNQLYRSKLTPQTWDSFHPAHISANFGRDRAKEHHWTTFGKDGGKWAYFDEIGLNWEG